LKEVYGLFRTVNLVPWHGSRQMSSPSGYIACGNTSEYTVGAANHVIRRLLLLRTRPVLDVAFRDYGLEMGKQ
jgi:hypothetical protein